MNFFKYEEGKDLFNQFENEYNIEVEELIIKEIFNYTEGYLFNFIYN